MVDSIPKYAYLEDSESSSRNNNQPQHHHHHALRESRKALHDLDARLQSMSCTIPLGVLANKQDHPAAFSARHVAGTTSACFLLTLYSGSLAVEMLHAFSPVYVQSSSGQTSASELHILMDWICTQAKLRQKQEPDKKV